MPINAKRLLKLADYLEIVPPKQFSMSEYGWKREDECGFAGCAIGWAIHANLFPGLTWNDELGWPQWEEHSHDDYATVGMPFEISARDANNLFGPHNTGTPKKVAKRIRKFVRNNVAVSP